MSRKRCILYMLGFLVLLFMVPTRVHATGEDYEAPEINWIKLTKTSFNASAGDKITIEADIVEEGVGVSDFTIWFVDADQDTTLVGSVSFKLDSSNQYTGTHTYVADIPSNDLPSNDNYYVSFIAIADYKGNQSCYGNGNSLTGESEIFLINQEYSGKKCILYNSTGINIINPNMSSGTIYEVREVELIDKSTRLNERARVRCNVYIDGNPITSMDQIPFDNVIYVGPFFLLDQRIEKTGWVIGEIRASDTEVGTMSFSSAGIMNTYYEGSDGELLKDEKGYYITSSHWKYSELNGLKCYFKNGDNKFTVLDNPDIDRTPPIVNSIEILTKSVTKPGIVKVKLDISDDRGIYGFNIGFSNLTNKNGLGTFGTPLANVNNNLNGVKHFQGVIELPVPQYVSEGTYVMDGFGVLDSVNSGWNISRNGRIYGIQYDEDGYFYYIENEKQYIGPPLTVEVKSEFDVAFETVLTNTNLPSRLRDMPEGKTALVPVPNPGYLNNIIGSGNVAKKEVFEAIKGYNKSIIFYSDYYQWVFNGKDITNPKDVNLTIGLDKYSGAEYDIEGDILRISFPDNGVLPGKANIRIKSDYVYSLYSLNKHLYLYYDNTSNDTLDLEATSNMQYVLDGSDHWCYFDITHNSKFLVSGTKLQKKKEKKQMIVSMNYKGVHYLFDNKHRAALAECPSNNKRTSITIPDKVKCGKYTYKVTVILPKAFRKNKKIKSIKIGANVKTIGKEAFLACPKLKSVTGMKGVRSIEKNCFKGCSKLKTITIKSKYLTEKKIASGAFKGTNKKAVVTIAKKKYKKILIKKGISKKAKFKY